MSGPSRLSGQRPRRLWSRWLTALALIVGGGAVAVPAAGSPAAVAAPAAPAGIP
ncbi:hypothetical protein GA0115259_111493, partial [Streptomyces sp. MnatMP-M17]